VAVVGVGVVVFCPCTRFRKRLDESTLMAFFNEERAIEPDNDAQFYVKGAVKRDEEEYLMILPGSR
jgi:hypothetical protein